MTFWQDLKNYSFISIARNVVAREKNKLGVFGKLTFTQIPQPIQSVSDMKAIFDVGITSMHSFPKRAEKNFTFKHKHP